MNTRMNMDLKVNMKVDMNMDMDISIFEEKKISPAVGLLYYWVSLLME
jgi:hypothetical protein